MDFADTVWVGLPDFVLLPKKDVRDEKSKMTTLSIRARVFIGLVLSSGCLGIIGAFPEPVLRDLPRFLCYFLLALVSSGLKVSLPGVTGTMSVNFLFILMGVAELNLPQTLILGIGAATVQIFWHAKKTHPSWSRFCSMKAPSRWPSAWRLWRTGLRWPEPLGQACR